MSTPTELQYLFHHIFLPPNLPQADDDGAENDNILARTMLECAEAFSREARRDGYTLAESWDLVPRILESLIALSSKNPVTEDQIRRELSKLRVGDVFVHLVRAQNAGVIIRLDTEEVMVEVFEVTAPNADIMKCEGKMQSLFPTHAIPVPFPIFSNPTFQKNFAIYLFHMSIDELEESAAHTKKAGSTVVETRDSPDPKFITDLLVTVLASTSNTSAVQDPVRRATKRIADDVLWKNTLAPWRRSKLWLVIRVALQTTLEPRDYKAFMVFSMTLILQRAIDLDCGNDTIRCMMVKCSRRAVKLTHSHAYPHFLDMQVSAACTKADELLQKRWNIMLSNIEPELSGWDPARLSIQDDTALQLRNSGPIIEKILKSPESAAPTPSFYQPTHVSRLKVEDYSHLLQNLSFRSGEDMYISLIDFENATRQGLREWTQQNLSSITAEDLLLQAIRTYYSAASVAYESNAEDRSLAILTVMELWRSIDQIAIAQCSMIQDYPPEVSLTLLEHLLLSHKEDLDRVTDLTVYIKEREQNVVYQRSVFEKTSTQNSFAIRYYDGSRDMIEAMSAIDEQAKKDKSKKIAEMERLNAEYQDLKYRASRLSHDHREYTTGWGWQRRTRIDTSLCESCRLNIQADNMEIHLHEWPLPRDNIVAKTVIFELHCPSMYAKWREATYTVLHDLFSSVDDQPKTQTFVLLNSYMDGISVNRTGTRRISLASSTKSFLASHYRPKKIPVSHESEVCVNNGLTWELCDSNAQTWIEPDDLTHVDVPSKCCLLLPNDGLYKSLEFSVPSSSHYTNTVLAGQASCSRDLSLHEFFSFGSLRAGGRSQWMNIVRELAANDLAYHHDMVYLLIATAVQQVGPLTEAGCFEWHIELTSETFGYALVEQVQRMHNSVAENWQEVATLKALILMLIRLLSASPSNGLIEVTCNTLRAIRETLYGWLKKLLSSFDDRDDSNVDYLQARVRDVAATCRATFDVDITLLNRNLQNARDLEILLHCGVALHDNRASTLPTDSASRTVMDRGVRLMVNIEEHVWNMTMVDSQGMDSAVQDVWPLFSRGTDWRRMAAPNERWIRCETNAEGSTYAQNVQMNILDGRLLIDGKPLGALPDEITIHAVYKRLFGKTMLLVIPANLAGMDFQSRAKIEGSQVYLGLRDGNLIVKTKSEIGTIRQYIHHLHFENDIPSPLIDDFAHWLNMGTHNVEFRPLHSPWTLSPANTKYCLQFNLWSFRLSKVHDQRERALVDPNSASFQMIYSRLSSIEEKRFVTIFHHSDTHGVHLLTAHLPRFKLDFLLDTANLELVCENISDTVVDENQSIGTLYGLENRLVLRERTESQTRPRSRSVLIPSGDVSYSREGDHVSVRIATGGKERVSYNIYIVDTLVGQISDDGTLESRLYKIYLLALTSHWLPDVLTGRTGTEEALSELNSSRCMSFMKLKEGDIKLLRLLKDLSPLREFYPSHLQVMQTVHWGTLPVSSQSYEFEEAVLRILQFDQRLTVFDDSVSSDTLAGRDDYNWKSAKTLVRRAQARELSSRPLTLATAELGRDHVLDVVYESRAQQRQSNDAPYKAALAVFQEKAGLFGHQYQSSDLRDELKSLGLVSRTGTRPPHLSYSRYWLELPNLASDWIMLYESTRNTVPTREEKKYQLLFSLPAQVYSASNSSAFRLTAQILAFAFSEPVFRSHDPPQWPSYNFSDYGDKPDESLLSRQVQNCERDFVRTTSSSLPRRSNEDDRDWEARCQSQYLTVVRAQTTAFTAQLMMQWPCLLPVLPTTSDFDHLNMAEALDKARKIFRHCFHNRELCRFAERVQCELNRIEARGFSSPLRCSTFYDQPAQPSHFSRLPDFLNMSHRQAPNMEALILTAIYETPTTQLDEKQSQSLYEADSAQRLQSVVAAFSEDQSKLARTYGRYMERSLDILLEGSPDGFSANESSGIPLQTYLTHCQSQYQLASQAVLSAVQPRSPVEILAQRAGISFPRFTIRHLLFFMTWSYWTHIPAQWKTALTIFANAIICLQQAYRIIQLDRQKKVKDVRKEVGNLVRIDGDLQRYLEHPDWLLIQIEGDFHLRTLQMQVALEMFYPSLEANSALQLNMGEGKSSVITPMVAASLSDSQKLVRVVALKSLVPQMFQLLATRLGDLCNRRIFFLPFSRRMKSSNMGEICDLYRECMGVHGILIAQPEHILSAKLLSVEKMVVAASSDQDALQALDVQRFLGSYSRDILDESDELLHVRYQLIYTMGQQQALDGHPDRWGLIQCVLSLAMKHAEVLKEKSTVLTIGRSHAWAFPHIRFESGNEFDVLKACLVERIAENITSKGIPALSVSYLDAETRGLLQRYLTQKEIPVEDKVRLKCAIGSPMAWNAVLVLRGILAYHILLYALCERRWRVDYGLDRGRSLLAVPYRAKDVPSLRAEFGHPDVAIALTCLAYYYHGLTSDEVSTVFQRLLKTSNPEQEYGSWVEPIPTHELPESLKTVKGINTQDRLQHIKALVPLFEFNRATINFYLREVVFPKAAKEFPQKLPTSGWDLAERKQHVTTGFSGTNDNRFLLPSSITQVDPCNQDATNALVLSHLLNQENAHYHCARDSDGHILSGRTFVDLLIMRRDPMIRVLLDVGAQVLDMSNQALVEYWLALEKGEEAGIFFNDADELTVITRDGTIESFLRSPYKYQTEKCLVYLDDAHTRGTDLKLPPNARAAVTLGRKVTKDRLVQGCMRMRQLGHGQSVMFFAPPEIDTAIRKTCVLSQNDLIRVEDILQWSMRETLADIEHHLPYWAVQGADYKARREAMDILPANPSQEDTRKLEKSWLQREAQCLSEMYDPLPQQNILDYLLPSDVSSRLEELGVSGVLEHAVDEEQEREVSHEMEIERQIERPAPVVASSPFVHVDVAHFVQSGKLRKFSNAFSPLSHVLEHVPYWSDHSHKNIFHPGLIATKDFALTVQRQNAFDEKALEYLNPVRWVLTAKGQTALVIISQFEANSLLPAIRSSSHVRLHVYTPRTTKNMLVFDDLRFYCVPPLPQGDSSLSLLKPLITQLNVFAGQLYPTTYEDYQELCDFLGIDIDVQGVQQAESDGFVQWHHRTVYGTSGSPFITSPVPFLKALMSLRRKHQDFERTPIGKLLAGRARSVQASDF